MGEKIKKLLKMLLAHVFAYTLHADIACKLGHKNSWYEVYVKYVKDKIVWLSEINWLVTTTCSKSLVHKTFFIIYLLQEISGTS